MILSLLVLPSSQHIKAYHHKYIDSSLIETGKHFQAVLCIEMCLGNNEETHEC